MSAIPDYFCPVPTSAFEPEDLIQQTIKRYGDKVAVACSFGKDSIVVLHMALKYKPDIKVMFNNTGIEFPETIDYKNKLIKEWDLNMIETKPWKDMDFWKCIDKYGLPQIRSMKSRVHSPRCCYYLKEVPAWKACKENDIHVLFTGLMRCESRCRAMQMQKMNNSTEEKEGIGFCGQRYFAKKQGIWKVHPIAYWSEQEVFDYIRENNISLNPVYTKWNGVYDRCGCLPCTAYLSWEKKLPKTHPKLYKLLKQKGKEWEEKNGK